MIRLGEKAEEARRAEQYGAGITSNNGEKTQKN